MTIIQAILPAGQQTREWFFTFSTVREKSARDLLPTAIQTDTLPFALSLAQQAFSQMTRGIQAAEKHLKESMVLQDILESSIINRFLQAEQDRITLFHDRHNELVTMLRLLREAAQAKQPES